MAIKKDIKTWAVKLRGRNFFLSGTGAPWTFQTKKEANYFARNVASYQGVTAEPVRVRLRIEEI